MNNLLLTLGHNASAIWTDGVDVIGYEEERLTRKKSDSRFPINAINEVIKHTKLKKDVTVYVSHWFDCENLEKARHARLQKYWQPDVLRTFLPKCKIVSVDHRFTHHDSHAWAAVEFYRRHMRQVPEGDVHIVVSDGFGTAQEVFSIYVIQPDTERWTPQLLSRIYGYDKSLGLLYQYATEFVGMTMNQDEYKFLGYESHVNEVLRSREIEWLRQMAKDHAEEWASICSANFLRPQESKLDDFIQVNDMESARRKIRARLRKIVKALNTVNQWETRVVVGHYIQTVIEEAYRFILTWSRVKHVIVTGGVHYNVKLNHSILSSISGQFCAVPLAGDQGAAIGVYASKGYSFPFTSLKWGRRDLSFRRIMLNGDELDVRVAHTLDDYIEQVLQLLKANKLVNTIHGNMEFGPRALCNTSTLAVPTSENVDTINYINGRNTVMPFAPVVSSRWAKWAFESNLNRVVGSERYMITTLNYVRPVDNFMGVAHVYPDQSSWSGRPQIIYPTEPAPIRRILEECGTPLINTSFNVHGVPIVFSVEDAINDLRFNAKKADQQTCPALVIGNF